jgi:hypothetical protein
MMDRLLANIEETKANQEIHQEEMDASVTELREDIKCNETKKETQQERMEALLDGLRSGRKEKTACQDVTQTCPEMSKAGLEEMEAAVDTFEEGSEKTEATDLEANPGETEVIIELQEVPILRDEHGHYRVIGGPIWL